MSAPPLFLPPVARPPSRLPWILAGVAAVVLLAVAWTAWNGAEAQRRDGEAALRDSAREAAVRVAADFSSRVAALRAEAPVVRMKWLTEPGEPDDWITGPWPQAASQWDTWLAEIAAAMRGGDAAAARRLLVQHDLSKLTPADVTASGLPVAPLAARWAKLSAPAGPERERAALAVMEAAVAYPSALTSTLAEEAAAVLTEPPRATVLREKASQLADLRTALLQHSSEVAAGAAWIGGETEARWHLERDAAGTTFRALTLSQLAAAATASGIGEIKAAPGLTGGWLFHAELDGTNVQELVSVSELARATQGAISIRVLEGDPRLAMSALDRQLFHQRWLIGGATAFMLAAMGGFLTSMNRQRRLNTMMANFVAAVSHELRAPAASMGLLAERLSDGGMTDAAEREQHQRLIARECRRLTATVENVLTFSRQRRGRHRHEPELSDITALVRDALETARPLAAERRITLSAHLPPEPVEREVDPVSLRQALLNLLDNALKFSPPDCTIDVVLHNSPAGLTIGVRDRGPGVPAGERARIFEAFYRSGSELRRETPGIGIGLAIVKEAALAHGGTATVAAAPGGGAEFTIVLPSA